MIDVTPSIPSSEEVIEERARAKVHELLGYDDVNCASPYHTRWPCEKLTRELTRLYTALEDVRTSHVPCACGARWYIDHDTMWTIDHKWSCLTRLQRSEANGPPAPTAP